MSRKLFDECIKLFNDTEHYARLSKSCEDLLRDKIKGLTTEEFIKWGEQTGYMTPPDTKED